MPQSPPPLIYVVDDDPILVDLFVQILSSQGYDVRGFRSGEAAWKAIQSEAHKPVLLITDHQMEGFTGLELIERCSGMSPAPQTILISGSVDVRILDDAQISPTRFIPKPFMPEKLRVAVRELLEGAGLK